MRGTVKPHSPFSAEDDARKLRTAMKGLGTDEKAIVSVLAYRSNDQRQEINIKFKSMFGRDLISDLKSELSGHFEEVVLGLMMTPPEYDAAAVYNAIKGLGTDESTLIEILCTRSNDEIVVLKKQYKSVYGKDVEKDVASDTSGHFKRVLISLLTVRTYVTPSLPLYCIQCSGTPLCSSKDTPDMRTPHYYISHFPRLIDTSLIMDTFFCHIGG
jgi:hypothetical protein